LVILGLVVVEGVQLVAAVFSFSDTSQAVIDRVDEAERRTSDRIDQAHENTAEQINGIAVSVLTGIDEKLEGVQDPEASGDFWQSLQETERIQANWGSADDSSVKGEQNR